MLLGAKWTINQRKRITAIGTQIGTINRQRGLSSQFLPIAQRGSNLTKWASLHAKTQDPILWFKARTLRLNTENTCRCVMTSWLHQVYTVTNRQRNQLKIIQGIATDVNLTCLGITDGNAIIRHRCMMGTEVSYWYSLHATNTTIVSYIGASKPFDDIRQILQAKSLYGLAVHLLHRFSFLHTWGHPMTDHQDTIQLACTIGNSIGGLRLRHCATQP